MTKTEQRRSSDSDWVEIPTETNGGRKILTIASVVLLLAALVVGALIFWGARLVDPAGEPGELVGEIEIPSGSSTEAIANQLADEGVVSNGRLFSAYIGIKSAGPFAAGRYASFQEDMSFDEAIAVLDEGPLPPGAVSVRIVEGSRLAEVLEQIAEQHPNVTEADLMAVLGAGTVTSKYLPEGNTNLEGMLFPDTYEFADDATAQQILQTLADEMTERLDELGYERAETLQGRPAYDLVNTASLVERETGSPPEERGKIARVIYNRLDAEEPLGIDAPILYGLGRTSGELTQSELETDGPYNTRLRTGLPPTPIGMPGLASLEAAIATPEGNWRYYVLTSNDPPAHFFTDSYQEFLEAKDEAQANGVF